MRHDDAHVQLTTWSFPGNHDADAGAPECCPSTITAHALAPSSADSSLWSLSEIEEALAMAGTGSSVS